MSFLELAKVGDVAGLQAALAADSSLIGFRGKGTSDAVVGNTATHWAAAKNQPAALAFLLKSGADPHATNNGDSTPLATAVMSGHAECCRVLCEAGANPVLADEFGDSPISLAERAGRTDLVALLSSPSAAAGGGAGGGERASGAAAPAATSAPVPTPQFDAAELKQRGNAAFSAKAYDEAIEWYSAAIELDGGVKGEAAAALYSNRSACYLALQACDLALADAQTAVDLRPTWAKAHSRVGAALYGLKELPGALAAYQKALALEPTSEAAQASVKELKLAIRNQRLEALIERGAFEKKRREEEEEEEQQRGAASGPTADGAGGSEGGMGGGDATAAAAPTTSAAAAKPEKTPEQLAYMADVAEWMGAAKRGDVDMLSRLLADKPWLLSNRSENTAESLLGNTALHWACANGRADAARWLLSQPDADVCWRNHGGGTPLHSAAAHARAEVVALLLEHGADASCTDENKDTPRDAAWRRGYRSTEAALDRGPLTESVRWFAQTKEEAGGAEAGGGGGSSGGAARLYAPRARPRSVEEAKAAGNQGFAQTGVLGPRAAIWHYTDALLLHRKAHPTPLDISDAGDSSGGGRGGGDGVDVAAPPAEEAEAAAQAEAVLLSNRSAAHAKLGQYHAALEDAALAVALQPSWGKAHGRVGAAYLGLGDARKAAESYRIGLTHEPGSAQLAQGYEDACKRIE